MTVSIIILNYTGTDDPGHTLANARRNELGEDVVVRRDEAAVRLKEYMPVEPRHEGLEELRLRSRAHGMQITWRYNLGEQLVRLPPGLWKVVLFNGRDVGHPAIPTNKRMDIHV